MGKIKLEGYICERCNHSWISRNIGKKSPEPRVCPKCKSPYWNVPRKNKQKTKKKK